MKQQPRGRQQVLLLGSVLQAIVPTQPEALIVLQRSIKEQLIESNT
jgi:hypothetical protein